MTDQQTQIYQPEPERYAHWQDAAGTYMNLFRGGQAWIKTDTVVPVKE